MAVLHADQLPLSRKIGFNMREAGEVGLLTDVGVAAANDEAGIRAFIRTAGPVHAEYEPYRERLVRAFDLGDFSDEFTAALINPLTTVAGLVNLTDAVNFTPNRELFE